MPRFITSSVVLLLVAAAGVIGGAQAQPTAVARPAARDSTASRGWGHKNKGGHNNKHDDKACVGAQVYPNGFVSAPCGGKHGTCCEGWTCKTDGKVSVKLGDKRNNFITSTAAPFAEYSSPEDQCCLPEKKLAVTSLFCPPDAITGDSCMIAGFPESTDFYEALANLACACCEGKIMYDPDNSHPPTKFELFCNKGDVENSNVFLCPT